MTKAPKEQTWVTVRVEDTCDGLMIHPDDARKYGLNFDQFYNGHMTREGYFRVPLPQPAPTKTKARPISETLIPTYALRWFIDYDGERILQQKFLRPDGVSHQWVAVPEVNHDDADASEASGTSAIRQRGESE